jgi:hypothetical protein
LGADNGTNVDIGYGQILRRMTDDPSVQYALVIPEVATRAAQRVSTSVRTRLGIELYVVDSTGGVQKLC